MCWESINQNMRCDHKYYLICVVFAVDSVGIYKYQDSVTGSFSNISL